LHKLLYAGMFQSIIAAHYKHHGY